MWFGKISRLRVWFKEFGTVIKYFKKLALMGVFKICDNKRILYYCDLNYNTDCALYNYPHRMNTPPPYLPLINLYPLSLLPLIPFIPTPHFTLFIHKIYTFYIPPKADIQPFRKTAQKLMIFLMKWFLHIVWIKNSHYRW